MKAPLNSILVGCGGIAGAWLDALKLIPGVTIRGLVDIQQSSAEKRRSEYKLDDATVGTDLGAMLKSVRPEVVFDCTVPAARCSVVQAALEHGCHVLSEKPMANSEEEARLLVKAAQKSGKLFAVMQNRRYDPRIRAIRGFLDAKSIGEPTTVNSDFYIGYHFGGFRDAMRHVLLLDMAIHSFDQARFVANADPLSVYCREWNPAQSWYAHGASAMAVFEMTNGIVYNYRGSWCAEGLNTSWECDWRIIGTRGSAAWDGGDHFRAERACGNEGFIRPTEKLSLDLPTFGIESGHLICFRDFLNCVRAGRLPETICTDNIKSLAMVSAAIKSAESGAQVPIYL